MPRSSRRLSSIGRRPVFYDASLPVTLTRRHPLERCPSLVATTQHLQVLARSRDTKFWSTPLRSVWQQMCVTACSLMTETVSIPLIQASFHDCVALGQLEGINRSQDMDNVVSPSVVGTDKSRKEECYSMAYSVITPKYGVPPWAVLPTRQTPARV